MSEKLYADNDLDYRTLLEDIDQITAVKTPVTTGSVTTWIVAAANEFAAAASTSGLATGTATHVGQAVPVAGEYPLGVWLIHYDRDTLTRTILDAAFFDGTKVKKTPTPFLIVNDPAGAKVIVPFAYEPRRKAEIAA